MNIRKSNDLKTRLHSTRLRILVLLVLVVVAVPAGRAFGQSPGQETYDSLEAATAAFTAAFESPETGAPGPRTHVFGAELASFRSGEAVQDRNEVARIRKAVKENVRTVTVDPKRVVFYVGALNWPFPIPLVRNAAGKWYFDTAAGREEYLNRRIGRNELSTMTSLRAVAKAQVEYAAEDRDGDGVLEYAQKFLSTEGAKDGLYWATAEGEPMSPVGNLVANLRDEGYAAGAPSYRGYKYALLKSQGAAAVGGAKEYLAGDNLVRGFAIVAYPVSWGASGIMTFVIGPDGRVFEKNLGPKTAELAPAIDKFNPDSSWRLSEE